MPAGTDKGGRDAPMPDGKGAETWPTSLDRRINRTLNRASRPPADTG